MGKNDFLNIFEGVKHPRVERTKFHPFEGIMGLGLLGALAGIVILQPFFTQNKLEDLPPSSKREVILHFQVFLFL